MSDFRAISGKDVPESGRDVTAAIQTLLPTSPVLWNSTAKCLAGYSMCLSVFELYREYRQRKSLVGTSDGRSL